MVKDKKGRLFEVEHPKVGPTGKPVILNNLGKEVEIERATMQNGKPVFLDKAGKQIQKPKPVISPHLLKLPQVNLATPAKRIGVAQKFIINGKPIFLDPTGTPIDTEEGQADGSVLMAQPGAGSTVGSLIYYASMVNDVYAYFLTGAKTGGITPAPTQFPTTSSDLAKITSFASGHGKTFPDPNALAIEVKTAWIETTGLANPGSYITMKATIPTYNTSSNTQWTANGSREATLALISVHVVGSTQGHPEMIWATFEHFGNTPNAAYTYTSTTGPKTVPQNTSGTWLFSANGSSGPFNIAHMTNPSGDTITAVPGQTISPSNTLRVLPWGMAGTNAASNTQLVSINHSVSSQMPSGDIRNNYFMIGATWTIGGAPPNNSNQVGTNQLSNSALETYVQGPGTNCFSCHNGNMLGDSPFSGLSHIWFPLQPLPL